MFCHLNVHSHFSRMQGTASIEALVERAKTYGMTHLALTEVNGLWGFINFTRVTRQAGIRAICGAHVLAGSDPAKPPAQDLVLLVENQAGYENLCRILSKVHDNPTLDIVTALKTWGEGLLVLCPSPFLLQQLVQVVPKANLFGELRPGINTTQVLTACENLGIETVSTGEVYFLEPEDALLYHLLRAIDRNVRLSELPDWEIKSESHYFASEQQIRRRYPHCPETVDRTVEIAARCKTEWDFSATIFPGLDPGQDAEAQLRKLVYEGAAKRYPTPPAPDVVARIEKELNLICSKGFAPYFLIVRDIVNRSNMTIGRGSAAASIVSYCLHITQVDPIKHNLAFERFLNPERTDMPDIDIDFPWDERDSILDYVFKKYGESKAAMVSNQVLLKPRSAVREVAKVYGLSNEEILNVTKRIALVFAESGHPNKWAHYSLNHDPLPFSSVSTAKEHPLHLDASLEEVLQLAMRLIGVFHYPSMHSGGVVIVPDEIRRYVPVLKAPKGLQITEWEKDQVEDAGLVKIDLLGNRSLAVVRDTLRHINLYRSAEDHLAYHNLQPIGDAKTTALMQQGRTLGIFYIESPATRQLLRKAGRVDFEHVVIYSSIIRPAANRFCNLLIERIHGKPWKSLHPDLDFLNESYGIMVYQEQVAITARVLAGFSYGEADQLQKIGTKKSLKPMIPAFRKKFIAQAIEHGYSKEVVQQLWEMIESFRGYSFTKAHSASYARLSFVCAYLKAHYPAEFMAAVISNRGGFYSPYVYMSEARRLGICILPPHINRSLFEWKGHKEKIRVGFMEIRNLQQGSIQTLLDERKQGDFASLNDFLQCVEIPFGDTRSLIRAGCFDELEPDRSRPDLLLELMGHHYKSNGYSAIDDFFHNGHSSEANSYHLRALSGDQLFQMETESFGYPISQHPLAPYEAYLEGRVVRAVDIARHTGHSITLAGVCLTTKTVKTRQGEPMEFLTFEDQTRVFECVLFPDQYKLFNDLVRWERLFIIQGKVGKAYGVYTVTIEKLASLSQALKNRCKRHASIPITSEPGY